MGPYNIPRNVKDEGRILFIFTGKSMITTTAGLVIGFLFYGIFASFGAGIIGIIVAAILTAIGFGIGTFKVPDSSAFEMTRKTGGENIDDVIVRAIKFKMRKDKIYVYDEEETKDE